MTNYVLDTSALVAFFNDESGADVIEELFLEMAAGICVVKMNKYNLLETYYGYLRANGEAFAEKILKSVEESCINIVDVLTNDILRQAGKLKVAYKISLADAMVLSQASIDNAVVVTSDHHELDAVAHDGKIKFMWIR